MSNKRMKTRSKYSYVSVMLTVVGTVLAMLTFDGCKKRPYTRVAQLPLRIELDWAKVEEGGGEIPQTLKLFLFKEDGTLFRHCDISKDGQVLDLLEVGTYKAICVNVNDHVEVINSNQYETTQIAAKKVSAAYLERHRGGVVSKAEASPIVYQPEWIYSSCLSEIKVGDPTITDESYTVSTVVMPMQQRVKVVDFSFTVSGLTGEIKGVYGLLDNVASAVNLADGTLVRGCGATCPFQVGYRADGTLGGTMLIFGNEVDIEPDLRNILRLEFETESGRRITQEEDITDLMKEAEGEGKQDIHVEANFEVKIEAGFVTVVVTWTPGTTEDVDGQ